MEEADRTHVFYYIERTLTQLEREAIDVQEEELTRLIARALAEARRCLVQEGEQACSVEMDYDHRRPRLLS